MSATGRTVAVPQVPLFELGGRAPGRHPDDFYATPTWVTDAILPHLPIAGTVLEPSCGDGAILDRVRLDLPYIGTPLVGWEIDPGRADQARARLPTATITTGDFLSSIEDAKRWEVGLIIGNPPFTYALEFVEASIALAARTRATVAMLLRLAFAESAERAPFHREHPADVYPLASRPSFTPDGKTDSAAYAWWVWGPGRGGRWFAPLGGER